MAVPSSLQVVRIAFSISIYIYDFAPIRRYCGALNRAVGKCQYSMVARFQVYKPQLLIVKEPKQYLTAIRVPTIQPANQMLLYEVRLQQRPYLPAFPVNNKRLTFRLDWAMHQKIMSVWRGKVQNWEKIYRQRHQRRFGCFLSPTINRDSHDRLTGNLWIG